MPNDEELNPSENEQENEEQQEQDTPVETPSDNTNTEQVATTDQVAYVTPSDKTTRSLFGREMVVSAVDEINDSNVIDVVTKAFGVHQRNAADIDYLFNYYKGNQPVLLRKRELRPELTEHIVENRANEIVAFKVGYVAGEPIQYISAKDNKSASDSIAKLNDIMRVIGKHTLDKELIKWLYIGGVCCRLVEQNRDYRKKIPFILYTLDPRNSFVIHKSDHTKRPLAGVYFTVNEDRKKIFSIFTPSYLYIWEFGTKTFTKKPNYFGMIPIIEYQANMERQGCIEIVISLLDAVNSFDCDRLEAVAQFVQSLLVLYNCQVEEGTTANSIRKAGMILLKSMDGNKADVKNLSEQLDQTQNQSLKEDLYRAIHEIVGMPSQSDGNTGDSSNNQAVILKNGWQGAETRAKDFESEFKLPETEMMWLLSNICENTNKKKGGFAFDPVDVDIKFSRHNYENLLSKSQTLTTMLGCDKIHPKHAYEASGLFMDPEEACRDGMDWFNSMQKLNNTLQKAVKEKQEKEDSEPVVTDE